MLSPSIAGTFQNQGITSILRLIVFTAPLTCAIAVQTYRVVRGKVRNFFSFLGSSALLLTGLNLLSQLTGIGEAINSVQTPSFGHPVDLESTHYGVLSTLWRLLEGYFELYTKVTFFASVICGVYLGYRSAKIMEKASLGKTSNEIGDSKI